MKPMIAKCGYRCDLCLCHETNLQSEQDKQRMSKALATYYDCQLPPEAIQPCQGCASAFEAPDDNCPVFPCAQERQRDNCGLCPEYGCDKLKQRMDIVEECLKKHPDVPEEDYQDFFKPYLSRNLLEEIHRSIEK